MGRCVNKYDDDDLVMDIARGEKNYAAIAKKHGLSESSIAKIARGRQRPELQDKIQAVSAAMLDRVRRLGSQMAGSAMERLGQIVSDDSAANDETKRKASVDILKFAMGDPGRAEISLNSGRDCDLGQLSDETRQAILAELGGPDEDS